MKLKDTPWKKSNKELRQHIKKQRQHFANKGPYNLSYAFSLVAQMVKNLPAMQETWVWSLGQEIPWRRKWLPTPIFLPGESHGQRNLVGYSPWGHKELDVTEQWTLKRDRVEICFGTVLRADGGLSSSQRLKSFPSWRLGSEHLQDSIQVGQLRSPSSNLHIAVFLKFYWLREFISEKYYRLSFHYTYINTHPPLCSHPTVL